MRIAVLGAGNGGQATAAHQAIQGHTVRLYDRFAQVTEPFAGSRRLTLKGAISGEAELDDVTNDIARAVSGVELILVTVPGFAIEWMAEALAPHLVDGQVVILHPGGTGGALEMSHVWSKVGMHASVTLAETETLVYACRASAPGEPDVKAIKQHLGIAAFPAAGIDVAHGLFATLYPQATRASSVLATGLANMNAVIHPAVALLNAGLIDTRAPGFDFYGQGVTPAVGSVLLAVDAERMATASAFGVPHQSYDRWVEGHYGVTGTGPVDVFKKLAATVYQGIGTPDSLQARYISEDVPMALVPLEALARVAGVDTPVISGLVSVCSAMNGTDYRTQGRSLQRLGLDGLTPGEISRMVGETGAPVHA